MHLLVAPSYVNYGVEERKDHRLIKDKNIIFRTYSDVEC